MKRSLLVCLYAIALHQVGLMESCAQFTPAALPPNQLFTLDDGSVNSIGGTPSGDLLALNHFDIGTMRVLIDEIRVLWNPISSTVRPTVALYGDPNRDGNPADMVPMLIHPISIPGNVVVLNNTTVQSYAVPPTLVNGSFFVGAYLSDRESSFDPGIGIDYSYRGPYQSWIVENSTAGALNLLSPIGTSTLRVPLDTYVAANHMIQAHFVPIPEPTTLAFLTLGSLALVLAGRREKMQVRFHEGAGSASSNHPEPIFHR